MLIAVIAQAHRLSVPSHLQFYARL